MTYIDHFEQLAVSIKDENLVLASLGQKNVVLHHQSCDSQIGHYYRE